MMILCVWYSFFENLLAILIIFLPIMEGNSDFFVVVENLMKQGAPQVIYNSH